MMKDKETPKPEEVPKVENTVLEEYKKKQEEAQKEAKENYNKWLYLYADFENYKKRIVKEKADLIKYSNEVFARELLEAIDSLEKALSHTVGPSSQDVKGFEEGIKLTLKQFLTVLSKFEVLPIESMGKKFDPRFHEAISEQEKENVETGTVIEEHQKGYMYHDRLLRVAKVVVAKKKS